MPRVSGVATSKAKGRPPHPSPQMKAHVGLWEPPMGPEFEQGAPAAPTKPSLFRPTTTV